MLSTVSYFALRILKHKWLPWVLFALVGYFYFMSLNSLWDAKREIHHLENTLNTSKETIIRLEGVVTQLKEKELIRETAFNELKRKSSEKENELTRMLDERKEIEIKLRKEIDTRWKNQKFTGNCKKDIDILRKHAQGK